MRETLYLAGLPVSPVGWLAWGTAVGILFTATHLITGWSWAIIGLLFAISLAIRLITACFVPNRIARSGLHLASWLLFWRAAMHGEPWYWILVPLLFSAVSLCDEERRRQELEA